jgi:hypothetical protein
LTDNIDWNSKFINLLWTKSFKDDNFFYNINNNLIFNIELYNELILNIKQYKIEFKNKTYIHKDIVKNFYVNMIKLSEIEKNYHDNNINIIWVNNSDELYNYYDDLSVEFMQLLSIEE